MAAMMKISASFPPMGWTPLETTKLVNNGRQSEKHKHIIWLSIWPKCIRP